MIEFFVRRPVFVAMLLLGLCLLGVFSYLQLPMELFPRSEQPRMVVTLRSNLASDPSYVEAHAVIPMESAIAALDRIARIETRIDQRRATIYAYYDSSINLKYAYLKLQQCAAAVRARIGTEFSISVSKSDTEQLSNRYLVLQARGEGSLDQIRAVIDEKITPDLMSLDGVASVEVYGGRKRSVEVLLDEDALKSYGLSIGQVSSKISEQSGKRLYLGQAEDGRKDVFVNLISEYGTLPSIGDLVVKDKGPIVLKQIAKISEGGAEVQTISRINGREAVTLSLQRSWEANLISLARRTRQAVSRLNQSVQSDGINLIIQADEAKIVEDNIQSILWLILIGGGLAVAVLWLFLRNAALVLTVSASVPISILISMNVFYALGISINTLTMVGLAIAVGMLVDCSVVVLENIIRQAERTGDVHRAVVTGTTEVAKAVFASTLTTIAVFTPFLFSTNAEVRTLGSQAGASIITSLLVSLAVAFLLIPILADLFLSRRREKSIGRPPSLRSLSRMRQIYIVLLKTSLRHPARTLSAAVILFFLSLGLSLTLSVNVPREPALQTFSVYVVMPSGTTLEAADEQVRGMDARLQDIPEIADRLATVQEDNVTLGFKLAEDYGRTSARSVDEIKEEVVDRLSKAYPRVVFSLTEPQQNSRFMGGSGSGGGIGGGGGGQGGVGLTRMLGIGAAQEKVLVRGSDLGLLRSVAEDVQYNISNLETVRSVQLSVSDQSPSLDLLLDQAALSHFSVGLQTVRNELSGFQRETTSGLKFKAGNEEIDIILKSASVKEKKTEDLRRLQFPSSAGGLVPLPQIARLVYSTGYSNINRINQEKQVQVTYRFNSDIEKSKALLEEARTSVEDIVSNINAPPGVIIEAVRDESDVSEFTFLIALGIFLIYMILASTFESFRIPLIIMFTLPLAGIGAFTGLVLTSNSLSNANVLTGFLILFGVVVNNGVLLIDYSRRLEFRKQRRERALMTAGLTRVRPILITSITTILGMLPVAMGKQEYLSLIGAPFAITVMGGLGAATALTLVLIPTFSLGLENALLWWRGLDWKIKTVQAGLWIAGAWFLWTSLDELLLRIAYSLALFLGIPAFTYFAGTSLRRSREKLVPAGTSITITIRNISKLYDDFGKFTKEWRKGRREKERRERREALLWQIPLFAFLIYFTYFYLQGAAWLLIFAGLVYVLVRRITESRAGEISRSAKSLGARIRSVVSSVLIWGLPLADGLWLQSRWRRWGAVAVVVLLWYAGLVIYETSRSLDRRKVNINRVSGRGRRLKTAFYRTVKKIPLIGARKTPFQALDRINLEIGSGMFGLVGPNGSGKTTLMRVICGILPPSRGRVYFNDFDLGRYREELQSLIGYLPQEFGAYENMTAVQFLDYQAQLKGLWNAAKRSPAVETALRSVHLFERRNERIKAFSGGMKQRLGIAQTLLHLPRILVVDEPTAGLDPSERIKFRNLLSELARDRIVIFSTHIIEDISSSCNRLAVLLKGGVRFVGTPAELVDLTKGSVWQAVLDDPGFEAVRRTHKVLHHMRVGDKIRVRILAPEQPLADACPVVPTLEDSYMWLLGQEV